MRRVFKGLLSTLLLSIAGCLFYFQPPTTTKAWTTLVSGQPMGSTVTTTEEHSGLPKLMDILGAGSLALAVWLWHKELGITGFGPFTGEPHVEQQKPPQPKPSNGNLLTSHEMPYPKVTGVPEGKRAKQRQYILDLVEENHIVSPASLAGKLGISVHASEALLYELLEEGKLRADGFPRSTVFTKADSIENNALDMITAEISRTNAIRQERRYVRIAHKYEVDSYIKCDNADYIIEVKLSREEPTLDRLATWTTSLLNVAKAISSRNTRAILAIILLYSPEPRIQQLRNRIGSLTLESGSIAMQIVLLSQRDLKKNDRTNRRS
jgi:hypothetical protein